MAINMDGDERDVFIRTSNTCPQMDRPGSVSVSDRSVCLTVLH